MVEEKVVVVVVDCANVECTLLTELLYFLRVMCTNGSAIAEGPRDVLVSRNSATTKYRYRVALFA